MKNQCNLKTETKCAYVVSENVRESADVSTLQLALADGTIPAYHSGQYVNVYFPELDTPEGKAYSMSSAPHEGHMSLTIRSMGEFSRRLCAMKKGDTITASLPYGYFYSESDQSPLVMIAGGIGITPFRSMIRDSIARNPSRPLVLFHTARTSDELIFKKEFDQLKKQHSNFKAFYFVTREKAAENSVTYERMAIKDILGNMPEKNSAELEFLICGSIPFVSAIWKGLRAEGVPEEMMYTEAFFSH